MSTKLIIDQSDAQRIIDYLAVKPFIEVAEMISTLLKAEPKEDYPAQHVPEDPIGVTSALEYVDE